MIQDIHTYPGDNEITLQGDHTGFTLTTDSYNGNAGKVDMLHYSYVDPIKSRMISTVAIGDSKLGSEDYQIEFIPNKILRNSQQEINSGKGSNKTYHMYNKIMDDMPGIYNTLVDIDNKFDRQKSLANVKGNNVLIDGFYTLSQSELTATTTTQNEGVLGSFGVNYQIQISDYNEDWVPINTDAYITTSSISDYAIQHPRIGYDHAVSSCFILVQCKSVLASLANNKSSITFKLFKDKLTIIEEYAKRGEFYKAQLLLQSIEPLLIGLQS